MIAGFMAKLIQNHLHSLFCAPKRVPKIQVKHMFFINQLFSILLNIKIQNIE